MKNCIFLLITISCSVLCSYAQEQLHINTSKSELKWFGTDVLNVGGHHGIVHFKNGHFIKTDTKITGGSFIIAMNTIALIEENEADYDNSLVNHLKNEDFFDVKKFSVAKLVITNTHYHDATHLSIIANLTIKEITIPIKFQAEVDFQKQQMTTKFKIDRTRWGITYESQNYSVRLKDKAISDMIDFDVKLRL
ncbi:YceI family protein [Flagellimonas sp. HMM57]|uniref:YceI family protein n=1 Tax=unclassified Flagellimonas TaxID=2644544 RepID=UPI0013D252FE|nr:MULTISPECIES: YceI family protein [unclassified Flagellimonas]UII75833.1 YceI family protein [Flagellimonas sp. HMM57]